MMMMMMITISKSNKHKHKNHFAFTLFLGVAKWDNPMPRRLSRRFMRSYIPLSWPFKYGLNYCWRMDLELAFQLSWDVGCCEYWDGPVPLSFVNPIVGSTPWVCPVKYCIPWLIVSWFIGNLYMTNIRDPIGCRPLSGRRHHHRCRHLSRRQRRTRRNHNDLHFWVLQCNIQFFMIVQPAAEETATHARLGLGKHTKDERFSILNSRFLIL